jgi:hypothetical protein
MDESKGPALVWKYAHFDEISQVYTSKQIYYSANIMVVSLRPCDVASGYFQILLHYLNLMLMSLLQSLELIIHKNKPFHASRLGWNKSNI